MLQTLDGAVRERGAGFRAVFGPEEVFGWWRLLLVVAVVFWVVVDGRGGVGFGEALSGGGAEAVEGAELVVVFAGGEGELVVVVMMLAIGQAELMAVLAIF